MAYGNDGNPYPYGALANGIFQGFQMYNMQKDRQDQKADREFGRNLQTAQFGLQQQAAERAALNDERAETDRVFNRGLAMKQEKRLQGAEDRELADAPFKQRKLSAEALKAETEAKYLPEKYRIDEMEAKARIAASKSSTGRDAAAQNLDIYKLDQLKLQDKRRQEAQDAIARVEQLAPLYTDNDAQTSVATVLQAVDAIRKGEAPATALQGPALQRTLKVMYGRQVKEGIIGKKIGNDRPDLRAYGVQPGAEIIDSEPLGLRVDPRTGKGIMTTVVQVRNPDGTLAKYDSTITKERKIEGDAELKQFDLDEEADKLYSMMGARAQLADDGVETPEQYDELVKAVRIRGALHVGGEDSIAELKAAGLIPQETQKFTPELLTYLIKNGNLDEEGARKFAEENNIQWPKGGLNFAGGGLSEALGDEPAQVGAEASDGTKLISVK